MLEKIGSTAFDVNQLATYFIHITEEEFSQFVADNKVYTATLVPGKVLFTPCGMVVAEKVDKADSLGAKISCVPLVKPQEESERIMKMISSAGKPGGGPARFWTFLATILNKE